MPLSAVTPAAVPALDVRSLAKSYVRRRSFFQPGGVTHALRSVSFALAHNEILGLVGESGSGKSTIGKIIVGLEDADAGTVARDGTVIVDGDAGRSMPAARRGVGMIFQDPYSALNPRMTVLDIVGEGLRIAGGMARSAIADRVEVALKNVGLQPEDARRYPHQFSGGQRQRIGIARSLVMEPRVLVADEAVSSLDVSVQIQVLNLLLDIRERTDMSLIFITHNISVVEYLCDRVIVLSRGEIVEEGAARAVIEAPQHAYTRSLIEAVPRL